MLFKVTTEYFLYSPLSMIAEIGGYVGLLIGISLFNLTDFLNFVINYFKDKTTLKGS